MHLFLSTLLFLSTESRVVLLPAQQISCIDKKNTRFQTLKGYSATNFSDELLSSKIYTYVSRLIHLAKNIRQTTAMSKIASFSHFNTRNIELAPWRDLIVAADSTENLVSPENRQRHNTNSTFKLNVVNFIKFQIKASNLMMLGVR